MDPFVRKVLESFILVILDELAEKLGFDLVPDADSKVGDLDDSTLASLGDSVLKKVFHS